MNVLIRKCAASSFSLFKQAIGRKSKKISYFVDFTDTGMFPVEFEAPEDQQSFINEDRYKGSFSLKPSEVYEYDNIVNREFYEHWQNTQNSHKQQSPKNNKTIIESGRTEYDYLQLWDDFISASKIKSPWRNAGYYYACFHLENNQWSTPSWIWTNGAIGRYFASTGKNKELIELADNFLSQQLDYGAWIVRYDIKGLEGYLCRSIAPNDSSYICANTLLPAYNFTQDSKYLDASIKCANWIMETAASDGLVSIAYEADSQKWDWNSNIVDIGFTANLFVKLFEITSDSKYIDFAEKFLNAYIKSFYRGNGSFAAAIDSNRKHFGTGVFTRGQSWALEGMIPFYQATEDKKVKSVIDDTIMFLIKIQNRDGSWLHNYRPGILHLLSGADSKGVPLIAHAMIRWAGANPDLVSIIRKSVEKSLRWCIRNTATQGAGKGGIYSWNPEGAFAREYSTSAACVYSNCYLGEIAKNSKILSKGNIDVNIKNLS